MAHNHERLVAISFLLVLFLLLSAGVTKAWQGTGETESLGSTCSFSSLCGSCFGSRTQESVALCMSNSERTTKALVSIQMRLGIALVIELVEG